MLIDTIKIEKVNELMAAKILVPDPNPSWYRSTLLIENLENLIYFLKDISPLLLEPKKEELIGDAWYSAALCNIDAIIINGNKFDRIEYKYDIAEKLYDNPYTYTASDGNKYIMNTYNKRQIFITPLESIDKLKINSKGHIYGPKSNPKFRDTYMIRMTKAYEDKKKLNEKINELKGNADLKIAVITQYEVATYKTELYMYYNNGSKVEANKMNLKVLTEFFSKEVIALNHYTNLYILREVLSKLKIRKSSWSSGDYYNIILGRTDIVRAWGRQEIINLFTEITEKIELTAEETENINQLLLQLEVSD